MCCQSRRPVHDICDLIGFHSRTLHQFKNASTLSYKSLFHFIFLLCYKFPPFTLPRRDQTLAETELKQTRAGQKRKIIPLRNRNMCFQNQSHSYSFRQLCNDPFCLSLYKNRLNSIFGLKYSNVLLLLCFCL